MSDDWPALLRSLRGIERSRKLRLWCVAWVRIVLAVAEGNKAFDNVPGWFTQARIAEYQREADAGEAFADGLLPRNVLHAHKAPTGGPHNVFHFPTGFTRLTADRIIFHLRSFVHEFQIPTDGQLAMLLRDIFGNPFHPVPCNREWLTPTVVALARQMYDSRDFSAMPILADALQDAGCDSEEILDHCRDLNGIHARGCWVVDCVIAGK